MLGFFHRFRICRICFRRKGSFCFRFLIIQRFRQLQHQVLCPVGGGAVFILLIFGFSGGNERAQIGEIPVHLLPVFQGKIGINRMAQAGFLIDGIISGIQVIQSRLEILIQIAHVGGVQQLLHQRGGFIPIRVLCRGVRIGAVFGIRGGGCQFSPLVILAFALHAALHGRQFVAILPDHGFQLQKSAAHGHDGFPVGIVLFHRGLAGGKLHFHSVFTVAGHIAHGLPLKTGGFIHPKVGVAYIVIGSLSVTVQVGFKGRV